ncbi:Hypothetical predicted protein [Cloeon dipterum]|uniref:FAD-binding PCMH-type domain-containing protein n=2 Tax=Cloeon dipterum TaxID=197152 RepID=A0A8S1BKS2_9INSE|nr:Hypothetical predicted protein [Cloeon dipterum]
MWNYLFSGDTSQETNMASEVTLSINGKSITVGNEVLATTTLSSYLRENLKLTGTKVNCNEGICGACIVVAKIEHPVSKTKETFSINSCLVPILNCHGWEIKTIEGVGNRKDDYHPVQKQLAEKNATQCGFCSPGFAMNMFSLLADEKKPTMQQVEDAFGGNICRCTGYRSILEAYKAMASDAPALTRRQCADIEDLEKFCSKSGKPCSGECKKVKAQPIKIKLGAENWRKVVTTTELFAAFAEIGEDSYKLVAGNTSEGVYRSQSVVHYIDIKDIPDLRQVSASENFKLGASSTLTEAARALRTQASTAGFKYLNEIASHWENIANLPIRNIGTIAGNLSMKREHPEFASDVFTLLEAVGAQLQILTGVDKRETVSLPGFLNYSIKKRVLESVLFPALDDATHRLRTFHVLPRTQSSVSYVNAAFLVRLSSATSWDVAEKPRIVFGGIRASFIHATATENLLVSKNILDPVVASQAISVLNSEVRPDEVLPGAGVDYRRKLAVGLFYKFLLGLDPNQVDPRYKSGAEVLTRELSSAKQDFETNESVFPLNQPIGKVEALAQCAGEIEYIDDIPTRPGELHAAFVLTKQATGAIVKYNTDEAAKVPGYLNFYSAADLDGVPNSFTPIDVYSSFLDDEEIFCSKEVKYAGQPVGIVVAETRAAAVQAAELVVIEYETNAPKPVLDVMEVIKMTRDRVVVVEKNDESPPKSANTVKGIFEIGHQYPLYMENLSSIVVPHDGGYDVYPSTQWMDLDQNVVARTVGVPANKVTVYVKRIGGGFGGKQSRSSMVSAACALAAKKHNRAVRLVLPLTTNMEVTSKRFGQRNEYEVGFDNAGKIEYVTMHVIQDSGCSRNESPMGIFVAFFESCYGSEGYKIQPQEVLTNKASNGPIRGPGPIEGIAFHDEIMERIAKHLKKDPLEVKLVNMQKLDSPLPNLINEIKSKAEYDKRKQEVEAYNQMNRWKKRGLAITPMRYPFMLWNHLTSTVSIYQGDGSVSIAHGGIEMGQGLNTKITQVAAHILKLPIDQISVKTSNSITGANNGISGGSIISEGVSYATMKACQTLLDRLEPVRATMENPTWLQLIREAYNRNVNLSAQGLFSKDVPDVKNYNIWCVCISEVEVDVLTGERQIRRVDLLEDVGQSLSPLIDIGQIEGAFIMGLGYWLSEELTFDEAGRLRENRLWNYVPPGPKDIPVDFRVYLRRNAPNPLGVLGSKTTGEPAICLSVNVWFALRNALEAARVDAGGPNDYFDMKQPATLEHIHESSLTEPMQFKLK